MSLRLNSRGDTIVEVMIAIAIIGIVTVGASLAVNSETQNIQNAHIRQQGIQVLQNQMELIKAANQELASSHLSGPDYADPYTNGQSICVNFNLLNYDSKATYNKGDVVFSGSENYISISDSNSSQPTPTDPNWLKITNDIQNINNIKNYDSTATYNKGDVVFSGSENYISISDSNSSQPTPTDSNWVKINYGFSVFPIIDKPCNFDITGVYFSNKDISSNSVISYDVSIKIINLTTHSPTDIIRPDDNIELDGTVKWINLGDSQRTPQNAKISYVLVAQ